MEALLVDKRSVPTPMISGLILPSSVGPQDEKLANSTSLPFSGMVYMDSAAPTVNIFLAVPVVEIMSYPSFLLLAMFEESLVDVFRK